MGLTQWASRKRAIVLVAGLIVAVLVVLAVIYVLRREDPATPADDSLQTADTLTAEGNYDQALETLKQAEGTATTAPEKVALLNDLAAAAANTGQIDEALNYYEQKHQLDPESRGADGYLVGELYERMDNTSKAIEYFKLYLDYLKAQPADEFTEAKIASMAERIRTLEEGR